MNFSREFLDKTVELSRMLFSFGEVERVTHHPDGKRPETDTTHSVMLGVMACAFAREYAPDLDIGKIAQFALIHDLVEVYAGDTNTFAKDVSHHDKEINEAKALKRIKEEFDATYPWISKTIDEYESLSSPEARYVKVFDKILPKITHILNGGVTVQALGHTQESLNHFITSQIIKIENSYGKDTGAVMDLYKTFGIKLQQFMENKHI